MKTILLHHDIFTYKCFNTSYPYYGYLELYAYVFIYLYTLKNLYVPNR